MIKLKAVPKYVAKHKIDLVFLAGKERATFKDVAIRRTRMPGVFANTQPTEITMKIASKVKALLATASLSLMTAAAHAGSLSEEDAFYSFWDTVNGWTSGALGVGLATTMLLMGGAIGVAKNSPMPALTGIAGAAFLHWGPDIIQQIMLNGALV
jgi:conjugal transfer pilus assembly protein TraA